MSANPRKMTAEEFFGTPDLLAQLQAIGESDGWQIPAHLCVDVCRRAAEALEARP